MNWFARRMTIGAVAAIVAFGGCTPPAANSSNRSSGSLALSSDDALLYAVDTDTGTLNVIETKGNTKLASVKVGASPVRVVVGGDDTIYVANRGSRSVSVVRKGEWSVAKTLDVGVEPSGLALSRDGKLLLVVSAASLQSNQTGVLTAFDTETLQAKWELPVGEEPRSVAVVNGDRALVTLFKKGEVVAVDLNTAKVVQGSLGIYSAANPTSTSTYRSFSSFRPRAMNDLIVTPDGARAFVPTVWAREDAIAKRPSLVGGYYGGGGPCNIGAVATAGILTIDVGQSANVKVDDLTACSTRGTTNATFDFPTSALAPSDGSFPIQGPTVGTMDTSGNFVFVVNRESKNIAVLPSARRTGDDLTYDRTGTSVRDTVAVGNGADGIAVSQDGLHAYVYNQFDHSIDVIMATGRGSGASLSKTATIADVAREVLTPDLAAGRRLFFDATDTRMSAAQTVVACSNCHLDGLEDGHVWQFPDGPRQTPALAGRHLMATAPYHWSGEFDTLPKFNTHTITERMGGSGLSNDDAQKLDLFVDQLPGPDNGLRTAMSSDVLTRGRAAFEKAGCQSCHAGALFTNNTNADVGTVDRATTNPDNGMVLTGGFNVPSLLGVGRSAPYLHDGSQATLEDRVFSNSGDRHGTTSVLSQPEKNDLVAYLKSL